MSASALRYLALGDSYTIGEGVAPAECWPVQLARRMRERKLPVSDPQIVAQTGWTTDELSAGIDAAAPQGIFDLVSLLIGVNNQYRGRAASEYAAEFRDLLLRAVAFAGGAAGRVLVLSIPDWSVTPFARDRDRAAIAAEIDRFNAINRDITAEIGARYVDITPLSRQAAEDVGLLVEDDLHPSGRMYTAWVEQLLPEAIAALRR